MPVKVVKYGKIYRALASLDFDEVGNLFGMGNSPDFDSGLVNPGKSFSHKFNEEGSYPYYCFFHPWMIGEIIVDEPIKQMVEISDESLPEWIKIVEQWVEQDLLTKNDLEKMKNFLSEQGY